MQSLKDSIKSFGNWAQDNWGAVVTFSTIFLLFILSLILFSYLYGYWSNGLYGTHFDLNSIWSGVGIVITGVCSVFNLARTQDSKYKTDSQYNSSSGSLPTKISDILGSICNPTPSTGSSSSNNSNPYNTRSTKSYSRGSTMNNNSKSSNAYNGSRYDP